MQFILQKSEKFSSALCEQGLLKRKGNFELEGVHVIT